jgi:oxygen-dependent protoporphyrinogen oxidase
MFICKGRSMSRVVVVGGGISGLSVAYRLQEMAPQVDVLLLEKNNRPGGTLWTLRRDGFQVETGANGFLDNKPSTLALCRDLGLGDRLVTASAAAGKNRYLFLDGQLKLLPGSLTSFLRSDLLSWRGKLSFLWERFRKKPSEPLDESIDAFACRRAGPEVADLFADAMVTGIFAGDPRLLSLPACFPRIAALEKDHGSVLKGLARVARQRRREARERNQPYERPGKMWSFQEGLRLLVEALHQRLKNPPLLGVSVCTIAKQGESAQPHWVIYGESQQSWHADAVVLACPAPDQAAFLADLDADLARQIRGISYNRVAVIALGYRRQDVPGSLDGFGFIAPQRTRRDLLGVQWCSSIFPGRAPEGNVLMRALCGGWHRAELVSWDDDRLIESARAELNLAMGITAPPLFQEIVRWDRAIPQYLVGHLQRVAWLDDRCRQHPGLFLAGNAYRGVSLNDCTEQSHLVAQQVHHYLNTPQAVG